MGRKKIDTINAKSKMQSMMAKSEDSLNSTVGYKEQGNPSEVHAKAKALRK